MARNSHHFTQKDTCGWVSMSLGLDVFKKPVMAWSFAKKEAERWLLKPSLKDVETSPEPEHRRMRSLPFAEFRTVEKDFP